MEPNSDISSASNGCYLPVNLSAQFALSNQATEVPKKRVPKVRNKKVREKRVYDILQLDGQIKACFAAEQIRLGEYKKRVSSMILTLTSNDAPFGVGEVIKKDLDLLRAQFVSEQMKREFEIKITYREFICLYEQLKKLLTKVENLSSGALYEKYISLTQDIVLEYKKILAVPIKSSFLTKSRPKNENEERKLTLLDSFLRIANNFVDIEYHQQSHSTETNYVCRCGNSAEFEELEGVRICEVCGLMVDKISEQTSYKDIDRINMHQKYKYEKKSHFKEGILQYQGRQNKYIDPTLYSKADKWLDLHGLIDHKARTQKSKYARVRKEHLRLFMNESQETEITKHYEDINLIFSILTGSPCPDISHLEETLYSQFDRLVEVFMVLPDIDRTNFLNCQFVLRKLLLFNNHPIDPQDFPGLKTASRQQEHEEIWDKMMKVANLKAYSG